MLAQRQGLLLIGRAETDPIQLVRHVEHPIIDHFKKSLTIVNEKRHVVWAYFKYNLRAFEFTIRSIPKARVEKPRIMCT